MSKILEFINNRDNIIHIFLVGSFVALSMRSLSHQRNIEKLEAQKEALQSKNKALKKTMWDWKQELYQEASNDNSPISLSRLKTIYGEIQSNSQQNQAGETLADSASTPPKFVV